LGISAILVVEASRPSDYEYNWPSYIGAKPVIVFIAILSDHEIRTVVAAKERFMDCRNGAWMKAISDKPGPC